MNNLDTVKNEHITSIKQALSSGDPQQQADAIVEVFSSFRQQVLDEAKAFNSTNADASILASRGVRQLTAAEKDFYQKLTDAQQSGVTSIDLTIPETIIEQVIEDVQEEHPLLGTLKIVNTSGRTKWIQNASEQPLAVWGVITSEITKEIEGAIKVVDFSVNKLSAFLYIPKDIVELGATWIDRYVRLLLAEALMNGLAKGVIKGTGKNQPIGAIKDIDGAVVGGEYSDKEKIALTGLEPTDYCAVIAPMTVNSNTKRYRAVKEVVFVCNPKDFVSKVYPATTVKGPDGKYVTNVFPFPTIPVPDANLDEGEAVLMLKDSYDLFVTGSASGIVDVSGDYKFLEDCNTYLAKLYAYGRAKDNNACVYLDISGLKPSNLKVEVVNTVSMETPAAE